ncbi:MAG: hypothetical protein ABIT05_08550 [Chitinophagaceae bacterium]
MEVHTHSPSHGKKTWKSYFWEFFMLFLAVFCGFLAEYKLEHLVEKRKEKQIISALYEDLKKDTANLNDIIYRYIPGHSAWEDSAEIFITTLPIKENERKIALALVNATNWNFYSPPQVSLEILKSSGTFNLIEDNNIKKEIINFNSLINTYINYSRFALDAEHALDTTTTGMIRMTALRVIIVNVYAETNAQYGSITDKDLPTGNLLITYDKSVYLAFLKKIHAMDYLLHDLLGLYQKVLKEEIELLTVLKKAYHIK